MSFNTNGYERVLLPAGPQDDSYKVYVFVRVIDDLGGVAEYKISSPIIVEPNFYAANAYLSDMLNNKNTKTFIKQLFTGNLQQTAQNVISFATNLNQIKINNPIDNADAVNLNKTLIYIQILIKISFLTKGKFEESNISRQKLFSRCSQKDIVIRLK